MNTRDYELTHKKLIESAKTKFLEKGYEKANVREICKGAGVTNGAFYKHFGDKESLFGEIVAPTVKQLFDIYDQAEMKCLSFLDQKDIKSMQKISADTAVEFVDFIFKHRDEFKLILEASGGTKYVNIIDELVEKDLASTKKILRYFSDHGVKYDVISDNELHMITHSFFSCMFEIVLHDYNIEEAKRYVMTVKKFFNAGWTEILSFEL
ncbi:MAG: TetR/AcrR family transcriptional regulator [Eubacteriales bacterium]|nr:TetR/AcrR family transcriptional regulator [Eubacteriales bacterium]